MPDRSAYYILWFDEITKDDIPLVGGKNANLGEMYQNLSHTTSSLFAGEKIQVPFGFAVTAYSYRYFVEQNALDKKIGEALANLDTRNIKALEEAGRTVRDLIMASEFPQDLSDAIIGAYHDLARRISNEGDVDDALAKIRRAPELFEVGKHGSISERWSKSRQPSPPTPWRSWRQHER
jgi:pyruvate,water dikinase